MPLDQGGAGRSLLPYRAGGLSPRTRPWIGAAFLLGLVALWQLGSATGAITPLVLPSPAAVLRALWAMAVSGELWRNLAASLYRLVLGWVLGVTCGIAAGVAIGTSSVARSALTAFVSAVFPIPKVALLPLFIIWFGIGEWSKVATIAFGSFFPMAINAASGVDGVSRTLIRMGQSFGLADRTIIRAVIVPGAMPGIFAGLRVSASIAIILLVAAEMIGAEDGIGAMVLAAGNLYQTDRLLAGVVVLSCLGLTVSWAIGVVERAVLRWR
jgi:ABC-type nitrate/sulfonate/bicarbonate transport system permease component